MSFWDILLAAVMAAGMLVGVIALLYLLSDLLDRLENRTSKPQEPIERKPPKSCVDCKHYKAVNGKFICLNESEYMTFEGTAVYEIIHEDWGRCHNYEEQ